MNFPSIMLWSDFNSIMASRKMCSPVIFPTVFSINDVSGSILGLMIILKNRCHHDYKLSG